MHQIQDSLRRELSGKTAIATATFYNPDIESDVYRAGFAKNAIRKATDLGYAVVVVDGGSPEELLKELEEYGALLFSEEQEGMGPGRRQAIREAYGLERNVIVWTEPEKEGYIPEIAKTVKPIIEGNADMVIPKRKSLESYPLTQQHTETFINLYWKDMTGTDLDIIFGPRTWKRDMSHYFLDYDGEYGDRWDSIFIPVVNAVFDGKRVVGVEVDYTHPKKQTEIEEHDLGFHRKRIDQINNITGLSNFHWNKLYSA
jgi:glycosyltransferase involved in cell wall biosynthesis